MPTNTRGRIGGLVVPLLTPLTFQGTIDYDGAQRLVERVSPWVDGIFVNGFTGEFVDLPSTTQKQMTLTAVIDSRGRVPVYAGINAPTSSERRVRAENAVSEGADALVLAPLYHGALHSRYMVREIRDIARETDLPIILYNNPHITQGENIHPDDFSCFLDIDGVEGLKDSSGDKQLFSRYKEVASRKPGSVVFQGDERAIYGEWNVVPSMSNLYPVETRAAQVSIEARDFVRTAGEAVYAGYRKQIGGLKFALSHYKILQPYVKDLGRVLDSREQERVVNFLRNYSQSPQPV